MAGFRGKVDGNLTAAGFPGTLFFLFGSKVGCFFAWHILDGGSSTWDGFFPHLKVIGFFRGGGDSPNLPYCALRFPNLPQESLGFPSYPLPLNTTPLRILETSGWGVDPTTKTENLPWEAWQFWLGRKVF